MKAIFEKYESGWIELSFSLKSKEIDELISALKMLKEEQIGHFHFRTTDFSDDEGVADVEFSLQGSNEPDNMMIG